MAKKRRAEEYYEEEDTKPEIDSQEQEAKLEEDLVKLLEQISKQQLIEIIRSVSSENKKFTEEIHKLATEALREQIQMTACILASPPEEPQLQMVVSRNSSREEMLRRKIFVGNVIPHPEINSLKLYKFFSRYGEIEEGPCGFDKKTGKPIGFAIFMYKTVEGAIQALKNPIKNFYGHPLYCERVNGASGGSNKQKSGSNGLNRNLPLKNDDCNSVGSSPRGGAGFDAQIGVIGRRGFADQGDINGGSGITKLKSGSNEPIRNLPLKNKDCNGLGSSRRAGARFDARNGVIGCRGFLDQGDINGGSASTKLKSGSKWDINGGNGSNKLKSSSNGSTRNLSLKNDARNHGGNSVQAGVGAGFSAQNGVMGRRVLLEQWDSNSFFDRQWDSNSGAQLYGRGKEPIQRRQLDTSRQIGPSGHDQARRLAVARAGASVVCIGYYLEKLILCILCLLECIWYQGSEFSF